MYKLLLCWRYLRTRYLALACVVSVMLGVATLIVVNSVMHGFATKLRDRLHGLLSDMVVEARGLEGFHDPVGKMEEIRNDPFLGEHVEAMAATLEVFAMLQFDYPNGETLTRPVKLVGIDPEERAKLGGFREFLVDARNRETPNFRLSPDLEKEFVRREKESIRRRQEIIARNAIPGEPAPPAPVPEEIKVPRGIIVGNLIASFRRHDPATGKDEERYLLAPGEGVVVTTVGGQKLAPVYDRFVVVDFFKSEMSEYDGNYVFVELDYLQHLRTMPGRVTSIQIKLKDYTRAAEVKTRLADLMSRHGNLNVSTWEDKQGPLLAAIDIERGILNVLLFLIIAVAGFGILAIFSMIVAEKTRDIGIMKALGASNFGVMKIFLGYGLLLGVVGAGLGTLLGCWLTWNINGVEQFLSGISGQQIFDRKVYYFNEIPTDLQGGMLLWVNIGAIAIASAFSILPALRAACLHPVRALRYE